MSLRVTPHMTAMALPVDWMVESIIIFSRSLHCTWMLWMMGFTHASTFSRFLSEKKNWTVQMLVNYTWSSRNKIQWYKTRSKIYWTYPQTTGISCCLDVPCGSGPLEPLVTREKMTSSSKFPLSLKHFLKFWSNICRHGELNWDPCPCPCPCPGWPCWPWAAAPPIVIPVKHLKNEFHMFFTMIE